MQYEGSTISLRSTVCVVESNLSNIEGSAEGFSVKKWGAALAMAKVLVFFAEGHFLLEAIVRRCSGRGAPKTYSRE